MAGGSIEESGVFLVNVDGTLIDDNRIQSDLRDYLEKECGVICRHRYCAILDRLRNALGYSDYLGALQRYRIEYPHESRILSISSFLMDYPFADRLHPHALDVLRRLQRFGTTVILSDGDAVFQPRKIERSGIQDAVGGHVLIYIHKEESASDIEEHYPARHYVLLDRDPRILAAVREIWGGRVTSVLVRHGQSARDTIDTAAYAAPDVVLADIGELLDYDLRLLLAGGRIEVA